MRRVAVTVAPEAAEAARWHVLALFPEGFEEVDRADAVELAVYTDRSGEQRLRRVFPGAEAADVPDDWRDRWRVFHHGATVGSLWVGPPWEEPPLGAIAVVVDPGRAFGTGAHATTRLCLELLQTVPAANLVDVGCGSGVLAIAAAKLGFSPVVALDVDPAAVAAAAENAQLNGVDIEVLLADALDSIPKADVAVANITGEALPWLPLRSAVAITSGYLVGDEPSLPGYRRGERRELEGWAADLWHTH